jgi:protein-disulfide isomerase
MKSMLTAGAAALALFLVGCGDGGGNSAAPADNSALKQIPAPNNGDWTRTVVKTPEGGFRMGNPAAKVKLVEYGSLVCPHCAHFATTGMAPLIAGYVRSGKASVEYRHYLLNTADFAAVLLARCGGAPRFFRISHAMYAGQSQWLDRLSGLGRPEIDRINALPLGQRLGALADASGLTRIAATGGVAPAAGKKCLADKAALDRLVDMTEAAERLGVTGTPSFFVNGARVHAHDWAELEPFLKRAGG